MTVAILIPAFNASATLKETLLSIQQQAGFEVDAEVRVVLADDGSTDGTPGLAAQWWATTLPKLEVWVSAANQGERTTCNNAFERLCKEGVEWCYVLHADDVAKPHWLTSLKPLMDGADSRLASVCSSWDDWHGDDQIVPGEDNPERAVDLVRGEAEAAAGTLRRGCWWHFSGCAMHLPRFFEVGAFDDQMPQLGDLEWVVRCLLSGHDIAYLPRTLIKYRAHAGSVSSASFRLNRDFSESRRIYERFQKDRRLSAALNDFVRMRAKYSVRRMLRHLAKGRGAAALRTVRWVVYFVRISLVSLCR